MKARPFANGSGLYLELGQNFLKVLNGEHVLELPLARQENGRLTPACREALTRNLQSFLKKRVWQPRRRAVCAIGARGVSLRRLSLPLSTKEELQRLLHLQIESEFPVAPDALAWGYRQLGAAGASSPTIPNARQELLVVAVKKEMLEEYSEILAECGVNPVFTLAALARSWAGPQPAGSYAVLDIGRTHSELLTFDNGAPNSIRIVHWGTENITRSIEQQLGIGHDEAEKLQLQSTPGTLALQAATDAALDSLAAAINTLWSGPTLYLTGTNRSQKDMTVSLAKRLRFDCQRLDLPGEGSSAALQGLKKSTGQDGGLPPLVIGFKETKGASGSPRAGLWKWPALPAFLGNGRAGPARPLPRKWVLLAASLAVTCLIFPYAEALLLKPRLARKLAAIKADKGRLLTIDRELGFLQYLKSSQPPYLDVLTILANSASPGTRFDSLSMNRRGDLSLKGNMQNSTQVVEFRSKLIKSGYFAAVAVEEQTPTPDRQKVAVRITAQLKPAGLRGSVPIDVSPRDSRSGSSPGPMPMESPESFGAPTMMVPPGMEMGGPGGPPMPGPMPGGLPGQPPRRVEKSKTSGKAPKATLMPEGETNSAPSTNSASSTNAVPSDANPPEGDSKD